LPQDTPRKADSRRISAYFFGDSLIDRPAIVTPDPHYDLPDVGASVQVLAHETAGFFKLLRQRLQIMLPDRLVNCRTFARGGSTVRELERQIRVASEGADDWDLSILCVGINDIWRKFQGRRLEAVPYDEFVACYSAALNILQARSKMTICIGAPLAPAGEFRPAILRDLELYNGAVRDLTNSCSEGGIFFLDLFGRFMSSALLLQELDPPESLWVDGVHLSPLGNVMAADLIVRLLEEQQLFKELR